MGASDAVDRHRGEVVCECSPAEIAGLEEEDGVVESQVVVQHSLVVVDHEYASRPYSGIPQRFGPGDKTKYKYISPFPQTSPISGPIKC